MAAEMIASVNAAYTPSEIEEIMGTTTITEWQPRHAFYGINIFSGQK
jgi:hypothetical protein